LEVTRLSPPEPIRVVERAGGAMLAEIHEQPAALRRLLEREREFAEVAEHSVRSGKTLIRLVAHGSSDNAASYGVYAFGLLPGWTAIRDSISLTVYSGAKIDMSGSTVLALSQSGRTRDVVAYLQRAREAGAFTVAVTNDPASELAEAAEAVLELCAGPEQAIAATKTYSNTVAALALLAANAAGRGAEFAHGLSAAADRLETMIPELEAHAAELAVSFAFVGRMFVIGRGTELATAREIALKLLETCRVAAEPMTATAFAHGPVAALDALFPVWAIASHDNLAAVREAVARARAVGAGVVASGSAAEALEDVSYRLATPEASPPLLSPLLSVVPGQLFAWALAHAKGLDPDRPVGLSKVTLAQ
jgi:glucosamine--fructose-6-phosphate aminotransferase (isomerizing)